MARPTDLRGKRFGRLKPIEATYRMRSGKRERVWICKCDCGGETTVPVYYLTSGLDSIVIVGITKDGDEYFASSEPDGGSVVWMLERAKHKLLNIVDGDPTDV